MATPAPERCCEIAPLLTRTLPAGRWGEDWVESRYKSLFASMDLTRDFYFSYTYDLTSPLQHNLTGKPLHLASSATCKSLLHCAHHSEPVLGL